MKLESIEQLWEQDSKVDNQALDEEALKLSSLHYKYHKIMTHERLVLKKYEAEMRVLKLDKYEFYTQGPTQETQAKGWKMPPIGRIIKSDANQYIEADRDIIDLTLKIGVQQEKIVLLDSIIKTLAGRGYQLKTAVEWIKYTGGG